MGHTEILAAAGVLLTATSAAVARMWRHGVTREKGHREELLEIFETEANKREKVYRAHRKEIRHLIEEYQTLLMRIHETLVAVETRLANNRTRHD